MANVMASFAQYERRLISERTRTALAARRAAGVRLGDPTATPATVLARIDAERTEGRTLRAIAEGLNHDGVTAARGGPWGTTHVRNALHRVHR